jgi:hypothetical protein
MFGFALIACGDAAPQEESIEEGEGGMVSTEPAGSGGSAGGAVPTTAGSGGTPTSGGGAMGTSGSKDAGSSKGGSGGAIAPVDAGPPREAAPPVVHMPAACPVTTSTPGVWEDVSPPMAKLDPNDWYHGAVVAFDFSLKNSATIYLGSNSEGIFKTTDCGATWVKINTGKNGAEIGTGRQWSLVVDFTDPNIVYANAGYGPPGLYKSTNGGVDWEQLFPTGSEFSMTVDFAFVENITIDPGDHLHLMVGTHANCKGAYGPGICFAESFDAGASWKMLKAPAGLYYENAHLLVLDRDTWLWFQAFDGIWRTSDHGATMPRVYQGSALNSEGALYRDKAGTYYAASYNGVLKSSDATTWSLIPSSPRSISVSGNGTSIVASGDPDKSASYSTSKDGGKTWTKVIGPQIEKSWMMRYDADHDILYSSNHAGGFWRVVKP